MSFDAVARPYRAIETLVFGGTLQRARTAWLDEVTGARRALVIGEGNGRFLEALLRAAPDVCVDVVDVSAAMLELARGRCGTERVTYTQADVTSWVPSGRYDLVVTCFLLDCLEREPLGRVVETLAACLEPGGAWLLSDFTLPDGGLRRVRARAWLAVMYGFFAIAAGLRTRALVDPAPLLSANGLACERTLDLDAGFVRATLWRERRSEASRPRGPR